MNRRSALSLLLVLNAALLLASILSSDRPRTAEAQVPGGNSGFLCVTAKASGQAYDVVYLLDVPERKLHALYPASPQNRQLSYAQFRDLSKDLGRNK